MILQVGVKALIKNRDSKYLFLRRSTLLSTDSSESSWDIPGGRIHPDEQLVDALKREIQEEVGYDVTSVPKLIAAQDIFVPAKDLHVVRLTYVLEEDVSVVKLSDEHDAFKWVHASDIRKLQAEPYLAEVLNRL